MENYHTYLLEVDGNIGNIKLKDYLYAQGFSTRLIRKIKYEGSIWVNGLEKALYEEIKAGDKLVINFGKEELEPEPEDIPLNIIYEDHDLLVVNKEPFLVVHPTRRYPQGTLANAVAYYFLQKGIDAKVRFINRLDRNTSGIILISKNTYAHEFIQKQLKEQQVIKTYWALVEGILESKYGIINAPIGRPCKTSIERSIMQNGQNAITEYRVLEEFPKMSLLELIPKTGRTHQLRVHMAYIGHPIMGDEIYNKGSEQILNRQALHANEIRFAHPRTKEIVKLTADLTSDISRLLANNRPNV